MADCRSLIGQLAGWAGRERAVVFIAMEGEEPRSLPLVMHAAAGGLVIRCRGDRELAEGLAWAIAALRVAPEHPHGLAWRPAALAALEARFAPPGRLVWASGARAVGAPAIARPAWLDEVRRWPDGGRPPASDWASD